MVQLRLAPSVETDALVMVDDVPAPAYLGWSIAKDCYRSSCEHVLETFDAFRDLIPDEVSRFRLAEGGSYWIRDDRLQGPLLWAYNYYLLKALIPLTGSRFIRIEVVAPPSFLEACTLRLCLQIRFCESLSSRSKSTTLPSLGWFQNLPTASFIAKARLIARLFRQIRQRRSCLGSVSCRPSPSHGQPSNRRGCILIGIGGLTRHRFGELIRDLSVTDDVIPFDPKEVLSSGLDERAPICSVYQSLGLIPYLLFVLRSLFVFGHQSAALNSLCIRDPLLAPLFRQSFEEFLRASLHLHALSSFFRRLHPRLIISQGSYNGPHTRRIFYAAKHQGALSISIEQKLVCPNQFAYVVSPSDEHSSLPDYFIVAHRASRNALISWGVSAERIKVGYRGPIQNIELAEQKDSSLMSYGSIPVSDGNDGSELTILLLLSDSLGVNQKLLGFLAHANLGRSFLLLRQHPNRPIESQPFLLDYLAGVKWLNCSSTSWEKISDFGSVVAVTACSSAGIEALSFGCALIWLPLCSDLAVTYADMIESVGAICLDPSAFLDELAKLHQPAGFRSHVATQQTEMSVAQMMPSGDLSLCVRDICDER